MCPVVPERLVSHTAGAWPREGGGGTRQRAAKFSNCRPDKGALPSRKQGKTTLQVDPLWDYFCLGIREQITADTDNNQPGVVELINIFFFFFWGQKLINLVPWMESSCLGAKCVHWLIWFTVPEHKALSASSRAPAHRAFCGAIVGDWL